MVVGLSLVNYIFDDFLIRREIEHQERLVSVVLEALWVVEFCEIGVVLELAKAGQVGSAMHHVAILNVPIESQIDSQGPAQGHVILRGREDSHDLDGAVRLHEHLLLAYTCILWHEF